MIQAKRLLQYDYLLDSQKPNPSDALSEPWAQPAEITVGPATVSITILDTLSRLKLNDIVDGQGAVVDQPDVEDPKDRVYRLLTLIPDKETSDNDLMEALIDWLDHAPPEQAETGRFETNAKNAPLYTMKELLLAPGFTPAVLYGWSQEDGAPVPGLVQFLTSRWGDGRVNVNTAPLEVLQALSPHMTLERAQILANYRAQTPFANVQEVANLLADWPGFPDDVGSLIVTRSPHFTVDLVSTIGKTETARGSIRHAIAYVLRGQDQTSVLFLDFQ